MSRERKISLGVLGMLLVLLGLVFWQRLRHAQALAAATTAPETTNAAGGDAKSVDKPALSAPKLGVGLGSSLKSPKLDSPAAANKTWQSAKPATKPSLAGAKSTPKITSASSPADRYGGGAATPAAADRYAAANEPAPTIDNELADEPSAAKSNLAPAFRPASNELGEAASHYTDAATDVSADRYSAARTPVVVNEAERISIPDENPAPLAAAPTRAVAPDVRLANEEPAAAFAPTRASRNDAYVPDAIDDEVPPARLASSPSAGFRPAASSAPLTPVAVRPKTTPAAGGYPLDRDADVAPVRTALTGLRASAAEGAAPAGKYYVEPGDSFWKIAKKVYGNGAYFRAVQEHNRARFVDPADLKVGSEVLTPPTAVLHERYSGLCPKERITKPGTPQPAAIRAVASGAIYKVGEGDTLYSIARQELGDGRRWPEIFQLNRTALGADMDYLRPGMQLEMPAAEAAAAAEEGDVLTRQPIDPLLR